MGEDIIHKYLTEGKNPSVKQIREALDILQKDIIKKIPIWEEELYFRALVIYYSVYGKYDGNFDKLKEIAEELKMRGGWNEL